MSLELCSLSFARDSAYRVTTKLSSRNINEIKDGIHKRTLQENLTPVGRPKKKAV